MIRKHMRKWFIERVPDREALLGNRWLAPIASRLTPVSIWQFNRRSVARGLALGLFAGFILPIGQILLAALFAASLRANVLIASAATLVTNPLTFPPIYYAAYKTGCLLLGVAGERSTAPDGSGAPASSMWTSLSIASLATLIGLMLFATLSSILAYAAVQLTWRLSLRWRWWRRHGRRSMS